MQSTHRLLPLCLGLALATGAAGQQQRAGSQLGAPSQLGTATAAPGQAASPKQPAAMPAWTLPAPAGNATLQQAQPSALAGRASPTVKANPRGGLFEMADATPIVTEGRTTTAGELKKKIRADLVAKAGPAKTVQGGRRVNAEDSGGAETRGRRVATQTTRGETGHIPLGGGLFEPVPGAPAGVKVPAPKSTTANADTRSVFAHPTTANANRPTPSVAGLACPDKGGPMISEVSGRLKPGGKVTVWGQCFGERSGHVEVIGQFPGGKLNVAFTAWDPNDVDIEVPATVAGATDHTVAVTVVAADGRRSPAMQAKFVAARERIEVPDRLWTPASGFELSATSDSASTSNPAAAGHLARGLRINPQCGLDTMDVVVLPGSVTAIRGWEQGPPNEANVTIDWAGTCIDTTTNTHYNYVVSQDNESSVRSACRVALQPRAWAFCPVGVAP